MPRAPRSPEASPVTVLGTVALDVVGAVARLAVADEAVRVVSLTHAPGGTAGNVAMGLAKLGAPCRLVAAVGPDFSRSGYEEALRKAGVDLSDLVRTEGMTAHAFTFTDATDRQQIFFYPGASGEIRRATVRPSRFVHAAAGEFPAYEPHLAAAEYVSLDFGQELFHRAFSEMEPVLRLADALFVNRHERARLETLGWPIARLLAEGPGLVVETLGAEGQILHSDDGKARVPGVPARAVEPTGAGDAHRAGFLYALTRGADAETACRVGSVLAAFSVEGAGPQAGLPGLDAVRSRYVSAFGDWPL